MVQGCENVLAAPLLRRAPQVSYRHGEPGELLRGTGVLALFGFGANLPLLDDPRWLRVPLDLLESRAPFELWQVDATVEHGCEDSLRWSAGGGWLFAAIDMDEAAHGGPSATARRAYEQLRGFLAKRSEQHVLRVWNYLGAINQGEEDAERYRQFCEGRAAGMADFFAEGYPAATAIGHHAGERRLQVYLLACDRPGIRVENPRQVSAWCYPRQYGRTPPSFARAMVLPGQDALAISGTAAVVGHASAHQDDLHAQLLETFTNLAVLLDTAGMTAGFDRRCPLKVYVRHRADAPYVRDFIEQRLPDVPLLLLHGDICRRELLVEIDGWRYA
jgi:chorismate lyase / 3-hydroxybenzoate synthase